MKSSKINTEIAWRVQMQEKKSPHLGVIQGTKAQKAKLIKKSPIDFRFCRIKPLLASKKINIS